MPHFVAIETCPVGLPIDMPFGLAPFERNPFFDKVAFGFEPQALKMFGLFPFWGILPSIPFPFVACLLVIEFVFLLETGFLTPSHIQKTFHFHDGLG